MTGEMSRRMLVFDSAYTYRIIQERNLASMVIGRDLGGFFQHVWTIHPVAALLCPDGSPERIGRPTTYALAPRHTLIEGRMGRLRGVRRLGLVNFLLAQLQVLALAIRLVRREQIDLIRAEDSWYNGLLAWLVARLTRRPLVVGVWGNPGQIRKQTGQPLMPRLFKRVWIEEAVERFVLSRSDLVLVQNENNGKFVVAQGASPARTRIFRIGNLLAPVHFTEPASRKYPAADFAELGLVPEDDVLLCISRLEALKHTDHAVRAMGHLRDRCPSARLVFAGDGSQRPELKKLAEHLGVADRVIFAGNRHQDWLARVAAHVALVLSPLTGRALAEAALAGAPIVAYDIDWHGEVVKSGETGELVPHLDHSAMAGAAERLLRNRDYARRLGACARQLMLEVMDPDAADQAQKDTYLELLGQQPA